MAIARAPVLHPYYASRSSRNCGGDAMQTLLQDEVASCSLKANLQSPRSNKEGRKKHRSCLQGRNLFKQVRLSTSHWITSGAVCQPKFSLTPTASFEESPAVNGSCCTKPEDQWLEVSARYEKHFKGGEEGTNLAQALHEGARMFQLAIEEQESLTKGSWLVKQWIDFDKKAWIKLLSYQAAVYALLQAAIEIAVRGEGRDRDAHVFVQRSLSHQCLPLEASIREHLSSRDPAAIEWLWSQQLPYAVSNFVNLLEKCPCFAAVTSPWESALSPSKASDVGLITLAISCSGAALKLGAATLSCPPFSGTLHEEIGRLMHLLADLIKMDDVYAFCSSLELRREFLVYFGSRASTAVGNQDRRGERAFWVNLAQQLLRGAIIREGVRSKLNFHDVSEALEKNLAIFGFFAALGRRTRSFISSKGVSKPHESLASLLRYFEGGSVLFYPKFANLTIYQLFIEVVCEELEWLPFYPNEELSTPSLDEKEKTVRKPGKVEGEAITKALKVCLNWVEAFMNHNDWLDQSSGIQASKFLLNSELRLQRCYELLNPMENTRDDIPRANVGEVSTSIIDKTSKENLSRNRERNAIVDDLGWNASYNESSWIWIEKKEEERKRLRKESLIVSKEEISLDGRGFEDMETQFRLFDEELQSVEKALCKLESLLHETSGTERCTTSRMDLERIRCLKREAEALEASLKEKAILKKEGAIRKQEDVLMGQASAIVTEDQTMSSNEEPSAPNEAKDIEALRKELLELESRICGSVRASAGDNDLSDEDIILGMEASSSNASNTIEMALEGRSYGAVFSKSIEKLKDASVDVWRGTRLLGTDVAVAMGLLRRKMLGQDLTEREKKVLKRTLTDVASVIPIGFLMLLPVTAVGHAAMLAAIQKYVPALIPSAYGRERLDMLRELEQVRHMEIDACNIEHEAASPSTTSRKGKQLSKSTEKAT